MANRSARLRKPLNKRLFMGRGFLFVYFLSNHLISLLSRDLFLFIVALRDHNTTNPVERTRGHLGRGVSRVMQEEWRRLNASTGVTAVYAML